MREIQKASKIDEEMQGIKEKLDKGEKEMKGRASVMSREGGPLKGPRKDLDTKQGRNTENEYCQAPRPGTNSNLERPKTTRVISRRYYWPKISDDIKELIRNCDRYQRR